MNRKKVEPQRQTNFLGYQGVFSSKPKTDENGEEVKGNLVISINRNTILVIKRSKVLEALDLQEKGA